MTRTYAWRLVMAAALIVPLNALAHGEAGDAETIDGHHAALRTKLQMILGDAYDAEVPGLETADTSAGKALYDQHCASCHGATGKGDGAAGASLAERPSDLTNGDQMKFISDAGFVEVIRSGLPDAGMPAYSATLSEDEIVQVYAYTKTFRADTAPEDSHACSAAPVGGSPGTVWLPMLLGISLLLISRGRRAPVV